MGRHAHVTEIQAYFRCVGGGRDLRRRWNGCAGKAASTATLADRFLAVSEPTGAAGINRSAKGDREAVPPGAAPARTVQLRTDRLADTSVLVRIPVQKDARNLPPAQPAKPAKPKMTVACEPVVSVLTEVAKLLQPGRCVT